MNIWENLKKSLQTASNKTTEYTRVGRIKIDILGIKREIEEKLLEIGGRVYHRIVEDIKKDIAEDKEILHLIEQVKELEKELNACNDELNRIKKEDGIDLD